MTNNTIDRRFLLVILVAIVALPVVAMTFGMIGMRPMMGGTWDHGMWSAGEGASGWMLIVGFGIQLLLLVLIVVAGYYGFQALRGTDEATDPALEELRLSYARGDVSDEEFEKRKERLQNDS